MSIFTPNKNITLQKATLLFYFIFLDQCQFFALWTNASASHHGCVKGTSRPLPMTTTSTTMTDKMVICVSRHQATNETQIVKTKNKKNNDLENNIRQQKSLTAILKYDQNREMVVLQFPAFLSQICVAAWSKNLTCQHFTFHKCSGLDGSMSTSSYKIYKIIETEGSGVVFFCFVLFFTITASCRPVGMLLNNVIVVCVCFWGG